MDGRPAMSEARHDPKEEQEEEFGGEAQEHHQERLGHQLDFLILEEGQHNGEENDKKSAREWSPCVNGSSKQTVSKEVPNCTGEICECMKGELEKPFQLTDQPLLVRVLDTFNVYLSLHSISLYFDFKTFLYITPGSDSILGPTDICSGLC